MNTTKYVTESIWRPYVTENLELDLEGFDWKIIQSDDDYVFVQVLTNCGSDEEYIETLFEDHGIAFSCLERT